MENNENAKPARPRPPLDKDRIAYCQKLFDELVQLHQETNPALGAQSEINKMEKAKLALNKVGLLSAYLTEWAECQIFGSYYQVSKSEDKWIDEEATNVHSNELMWYGPTPEDAFTTKDDLICERLAMGEILHNTFGIYGRTGWRMSLKESLWALNEGQVNWLLQLTNVRQQGNAFEIQNLKWAAVKHIYRLVGEGWKKTAAQTHVAESCGVNFEAIKKWERQSIKERDKNKMQLSSISIAATAITDFKKDPKFKLEECFQDALMINLGTKPDPKDDPMKWFTSSIIDVVILEKEYPLETLKARLIDAGLRTV